MMSQAEQPADQTTSPPTTSPPGEAPAASWRGALLAALWLLPVVIALWLLGAHFLRAGQAGLGWVAAALPVLLLVRRRWTARVVQLLLLGGGLLWLQVALRLATLRHAFGVPATRMLVILVAVAVFTSAAALVFEVRRLRARYSAGATSSAASAGAFLLTAGLLAVVQLRVPRPMLLAERFLAGAGWLEVLALASYAAVVAEKLLDVTQAARWRRRIWGLFSIVFFAQLALGLLGAERFLMSGRLHLPVPALIVAGPLYRAEHFFMPILFAATVLLVGPAWCSHLCYVGAWDSAAAHRRRRPQALPRWRHLARSLLLALVVAAALLLRALGASPALAAALGLAFGLGGVAVILLASRRLGAMAHCSVYCPIGPLAAWLGKLSPFRLRLAAGCDGCGRCRLSCRYGALEPADLARRRPGWGCTLCGDCLASCRTRQLEVRFPGLRPGAARALFVVLVVALHAASLGLARI